jgi:hypothetical protein
VRELALLMVGVTALGVTDFAAATSIQGIDNKLAVARTAITDLALAVIADTDGRQFISDILWAKV